MYPCCIKTPKSGAKFIAIIEIILSIVLKSIYVGIEGGLLQYEYDDVKKSLKGTETKKHKLIEGLDEKGVEFYFYYMDVYMIIFLVEALLWLVVLPLGFILLIFGVNRKSVNYCRVWFWGSVILYFGILGPHIVGLCIKNRFMVLTICYLVIFSLYRIYSLWVVDKFMTELNNDQDYVQSHRVEPQHPQCTYEHSFGNV